MLVRDAAKRLTGFTRWTISARTGERVSMIMVRIAQCPGVSAAPVALLYGA
ncbi:hypothetical protein [Nocardia salmonicida]|uniref:hypothetical protein n=1 Tax=Nocardia salmonicida TaxID=53431 RepID=UPI003CEE2984